MSDKIIEIEYEKKIEDFESQISNPKTSLDKKFDIYAQYRNYLGYIDYEKSIEITNRAINLAKNNEKIDQEYQFKFLKSSSLINLNFLQEGFSLLNECLIYYKSVKNKDKIASIYGILSNVFSSIQLYNISSNLIHYVIKNIINPNEKNKLFHFYNNLMIIYFSNLKISILDESFIKSIIQYYEENAESDTPIYYITRLNLARFYRLSKKNEQAKTEFLITLDYFEKNKIVIFQKDVHYELGLLYKDIGDKTMQLYHLKKSLSISKSNKMLGLIIFIHQELSNYYKNEKKYKYALEHIEKMQAIEHNFNNEKDKCLLLLKESQIINSLNLEPSVLDDFYHSDYLSTRRILYIENFNKEVIKFNVDEIIHVNKSNEFLSITLTSGKTIFSKISFKNFLEKLQNEIKDNNMFLEINSRSQLVNLLWVQSINYIEKEITLRCIDQTFTFSISKRQVPILKKRMSEL